MKMFISIHIYLFSFFFLHSSSFDSPFRLLLLHFFFVTNRRRWWYLFASALRLPPKNIYAIYREHTSTKWKKRVSFSTSNAYLISWSHVRHYTCYYLGLVHSLSLSLDNLPSTINYLSIRRSSQERSQEERAAEFWVSLLSILIWLNLVADVFLTIVWLSLHGVQITFNLASHSSSSTESSSFVACPPRFLSSLFLSAILNKFAQ